MWTPFPRAQGAGVCLYETRISLTLQEPQFRFKGPRSQALDIEEMQSPRLAGTDST